MRTPTCSELNRSTKSADGRRVTEAAGPNVGNPQRGVRCLFGFPNVQVNHSFTTFKVARCAAFPVQVTRPLVRVPAPESPELVRSPNLFYPTISRLRFCQPMLSLHHHLQKISLAAWGQWVDAVCAVRHVQVKNDFVRLQIRCFLNCFRKCHGLADELNIFAFAQQNAKRLTNRSCIFS
jgi:hypothetical protein